MQSYNFKSSILRKIEFSKDCNHKIKNLGKFSMVGYGKLFLILILLISGVSKIISPNSAVSIIFKLAIIPIRVIYPLVYALSILEVLLAIVLLVWPKIKTIYYIINLLFYFFFIFSIYIVISGITGDCGCFGAFIKTNVGLALIIRNFLLLSLSTIILRRFNNSQLHNYNTKKES